MGDIIDKNGEIIVVGDTIIIGELATKIDYFTTRNGGTELMAGTPYGEFNVTIVEKL